jgi:galactokinase
LREIEEKAARAFGERFGEAPEVVASAPGRVNLIGEYTDFNGGFVLPYAIERRVAVAVGRGGWRAVLHRFRRYPPDRSHERRSLGGLPRGVAWALKEAGFEVPGFRAAFAGNVPQGAALSSSAAIEAGDSTGARRALGLGVAKRDLAVLCRKAENEFVGVESGIMDQYASLLCESGAALFIDCRSLEAERVPLSVEERGLSLLVCDTRVERGLGETGYNERRKECEMAAKSLGVEELRDAGKGDLRNLSGKELLRARHVVSENARVLEAVEALRGEDFAVLGQLMYASHDSLRDDFEISTPELDAFVKISRETGSSGARLTGGGFGGCAIALVGAEEVDALAEATRRGFEEEGFREPAFYNFRPATGAEVAGGLS